MGKEIKVRIIMRWNTTEGWAALESGNSILAQGEIGLEYISGSALPKMKIGTGDLSWDNLPYFETSLPKNFTWGNLRGTTLQTPSKVTETLELTKPGFSDTVNIATLNKNFDKLDLESKFQSDKIKELGERLSFLISKYFPSYPDYDEENLEEVPAEIADARIRFKNTEQETNFPLIGDLIRQIDTELQDVKGRINSIAETLTLPTSLELNEEGKIYLVDEEGNHLGSEILVKDLSLENRVNQIDSYNDLQDSLLQGHTNQIAMIEERINSLPASFPNNLIYEENKLYLAVNEEKIEESMVEITGGGGGGGLQTTYKATITTTESTISKPYGEKFEIQFNYSSINPDDPTDNDGDGSGEIIINNVVRRNFTAVQGKLNILDITDLISEGQTKVLIRITNSEGSIAPKQFTINAISVTFKFTNHKNFDFIQIENNQIIIPYSVSTPETFTIHVFLTKQDGKNNTRLAYEDTRDPNTVGSGVSTSKIIFQENSPGPYTLEAYVTSGTITTKSLFLGIFIIDQIKTNPYILMLPQQQQYKYGEAITFKYAIYDVATISKAKFSILSKDENGAESPFYSEILTLPDKNPQELTIQRYPSGTVIFRLEHISNNQVNSNISNSIEYIIEEPEINLDFDRAELGLIFEFDPTGKTNLQDAGKWEGLDKSVSPPTKVEATFKGVNWDNLDGWQIKKDENGNVLENQTMLRLLPGSSMEIPYGIFKNNFVDERLYQGYTIELELGTQNVTDYDALIIDTQEENTTGLKVYSQRAELAAAGNSLTAQFKEDERIRLTFTIESKAINRLLSVYINGVLSQVSRYNRDGEITQSPVIPIKIGAETSGIDVYFIRIYNKVLDEFQQLRSFCLDRPTYAEQVSAINRNDILNSASSNLAKKITRNSIKGTIPYIVIESTPENNALPSIKDVHKFEKFSMEFNDPFNRSRNFTANNCVVSVQGTSSAGYPIKNFKIKLKSGIIDSNGNKQPGFYFRGQGNSQPTKVFCLKADYASSESANNVMLVDYYNDTCPYRTPPQMYERSLNDGKGKETTRHGIHGEPIILFWRDAITKEEYFQGKYNFNDDKDAENVFGYVDVLPEDSANKIQCWEIRNNNQSLCLFSQNYAGGNPWYKIETIDNKTDVAWKLAFERRFPEQEDDVAPDLSALRRVADWVASTNTNLAIGESDKLPSEVYYKTLDTSYQGGTSYYHYSNGVYTPFQAKTEEAADAALPYSDLFGVAVAESTQKLFLAKTLRDIFEEKKLGNIDDMKPLDIIFKKESKQGEVYWNVSYVQVFYNSQGEVEVGDEFSLEQITDSELSSRYGVVPNQDKEEEAKKATSFAIKFFSDTGWTPDLYEKHEANTKKYRLAKFKNEFENYFILEAMAYYYVFTETVLLMDNRAKNMFLVSFDITEGEPYLSTATAEDSFTVNNPTFIEKFEDFFTLENTPVEIFFEKNKDENGEITLPEIWKVYYKEEKITQKDGEDIKEIIIHSLFEQVKTEFLATEFGISVKEEQILPQIFSIFLTQEKTQGSGHWAPTPYDMDSALGINNEGELKYSYYLEDTGIDGKIFTGQQSVLWNNFRDCFGSEIAAMYKKIRQNNTSEPGSKNFSFKTLSEKMAKHQEVWPENIWNIDQQIKYIQPFLGGENVIKMLQGNKRTQRDFWLYNAFKYRDSKYSAGEALEKNILLRLNEKGTFKITPYSNIYARIKFGNALDVKKRAYKNEVCEISADNISSVYDLETYIYSADRISSIGDLSEFKVGLCNFNDADKLEEILLGKREDGYVNEHLTSFLVGSSTVLEKINISNCPNLKGGIDVTTCPILKTFLAKGSGISGVSFSKGSRITTCHLPSTVENLKLQDLHLLNRPKTEEEELMNLPDWGLEIETNEAGKYNLQGILIENCEHVPFFDLVMNSSKDKLTRVRITGLKWHATLKEFEDFYEVVEKLKGYDEFGSQSEKSVLEGNIYFPKGTTIQADKLKDFKARFDKLNFYINNVPQYIYTFVKKNGELLCSYIVNEAKDIIDPTYLPKGENAETYCPIEGDERSVQDFRNELSIDDYNFEHDPNGDKNTHEEFDGWQNLPSSVILLNEPIIPKYQIFYKVKFFDEDKMKELYEAQWVLKGGTVEDPLDGYIPTKEPSADFSYTYIGWGKELSNIIEPTNFSITFSETINTYLVKFISGEKELTEYQQRVEYGKSPTMPPTEIVHKYFKNPNGEGYLYYEIYGHIGWDIYNDGNVEVVFKNDDNVGIIITPIQYTTQPINIHAVFSSIELITDNWETIIENCNNGSYKTEYPVGTQKEVKFTYRNRDYNGILEVVEHDKDTLAEDGITKASLTFILKDIFTMATFRNDQDFIWNGIKGPLAGGWTAHSTIYPSIKNIVFKDVVENDKSDVLNANIKEVLKKTDFGPAKTNAETKEYYPTSNLAERIWTPSASEMGVLPPTNTETEAQQGETYIWFTTNDSRKKDYNGEEERYWTRTWEGTAFRFYGVAKDGGYAYDVSLTVPTIGIFSFESAGLIFGLCI